MQCCMRVITTKPHRCTAGSFQLIYIYVQIDIEFTKSVWQSRRQHIHRLATVSVFHIHRRCGNVFLVVLCIFVAWSSTQRKRSWKLSPLCSLGGAGHIKMLWGINSKLSCKLFPLCLLGGAGHIKNNYGPSSTERKLSYKLPPLCLLGDFWYFWGIIKSTQALL